MVKKKKIGSKKISPYDEMNLPAKEVNDLFDNVVPDYEEDIPESTQRPSKKARDYLDEFPSQQTNQGRQYSQPLMFQDEGKENLIADLLKVDWERVEHIIRGHKPRVDKDGNEYFEKIEGHYLNEKGINAILHFLSFYLSKDIKLGRYSAEQVEIRMKQFSRQFTDFFFDNIEEFGLNTPEKKKMSKMFVQSVIDLVDASYSCAIEGKTIELMLKQFSVMQQEPLTDFNYNPNQIQQRPKVPLMQRIFG